MARFLVAGEALVDLSKSTADIAPVARVGGSPLNVAVGLGRLGHEVWLATLIGDDAYGELIREHVEASGVQLTPGSLQPGRRTSTALVTLASTGSATYDFELDWDVAAMELPDGVEAVHVGSIGSWLEPGSAAVREVVRVARRRNILVSYDPNARPSLVPDRTAYVDSVLSWAAEADIVKASADDIDFIVGGDGALPWRTTLDVVTHGADGVWAAANGRATTHLARDIELVDTVGAGDSFMAGLLDGLARFGLLATARLRAKVDLALDVVVRQAMVAAGITCSRAGADPPWRHELDAALSDANSYRTGDDEDE